MKKLVLMILLLLLYQSGVFSDPYNLSPEFRPVKITINWVGFNEEREHTDYEYNKKGQLVKASIYRGKDSPAFYDVFEYDENNRLKKKSTYTSAGLDSYTTFSYVNNKLFEEAEYKPDGRYRRLTTREYDKNGNVISVSLKEVPYGDEVILSWYSLEFFFYDSEQRISEKLEYYDGSLYNRTIYTYGKSSFVMNTFSYGDLRDVIAKTVTSFNYLTTGKDKGKLGELANKSIALYDGKEEVECCTTYTMKPEYDPQGNMAKLTFYNCENERTGYAVIAWEKGKTDMELVRKIFEQIHWYFTGC